jgi:hypothetical protein
MHAAAAPHHAQAPASAPSTQSPQVAAAAHAGAPASLSAAAPHSAGASASASRQVDRASASGVHASVCRQKPQPDGDDTHDEQLPAAAPLGAAALSGAGTEKDAHTPAPRAGRGRSTIASAAATATPRNRARALMRGVAHVCRKLPSVARENFPLFLWGHSSKETNAAPTALFYALSLFSIFNRKISN